MEKSDGRDERSRSKMTPGSKEWEAEKGTISDLYVTQDLTLPQVIKEMRKRGFIASGRMYKAQLGKWNMGKNASRSDWLALAKLFNARGQANMLESTVQIHNRIRRLQDLRRFLKGHNEDEGAFFAEAIASEVPIPKHIKYCNADGSDLTFVAEPMQTDAVDTQMEDDDDLLGQFMPQQTSTSGPSTRRSSSPTITTFSHLYYSGDLSLAQAGQPTESISTPLAPALLGTSSKPDFWSIVPQMEMKTERTSDRRSTNHGFQLDQLDCLEVPPTACHIEGLSGMGQDTSDDFGGSFNRTYDFEQPFHDQQDEPEITNMPAPLDQTQLRYTPRNNKVPLTSFLTACMLACMYGAARKRDIMEQCLQQASAAVRYMCMLQSPLILREACQTLTWLLVHAEGSLPERVMSAAFHAAAEVLGDQNPVCVVLEWMTAAAAGEKLKTSRVDSAILLQLWQEFNIALGEEHLNTMVTLYCLSFNLMLVNKDFVQAEKYLQTLYITAKRKSRGQVDILTINILATLSRAQHRQRKHLEALETINRSLDDAPFGLNHPHRLQLLLRKALILRKLGRMDEMEELYWLVVKGRVATLGIHHRSTMAAHESLVDVLKCNGRWEARKADAHNLLIDPQVSVSDYESWWRRLVGANRANQNQDRASSEETE